MGMAYFICGDLSFIMRVSDHAACTNGDYFGIDATTCFCLCRPQDVRLHILAAAVKSASNRRPRLQVTSSLAVGSKAMDR